MREGTTQKKDLTKARTSVLTLARHANTTRTEEEEENGGNKERGDE